MSDWEYTHIALSSNRAYVSHTYIPVFYIWYVIPNGLPTRDIGNVYVNIKKYVNTKLSWGMTANHIL